MTLHDVGFPGESEEYRRERNRLLEAEIELRQAIERVAGAAACSAAGRHGP